MEITKAQILRALFISTFLHILIASTKAVVVNKGLPNPSSPANNNNKNNNNLQQQQQQKLSSDAMEFVAAHNDVRRKKGVGPVQWDEKLARFAQAWATQRINDCDPGHHSSGPYGENTLRIKYDEFSPARVIQVWADEENNYDDQRFLCKCKVADIKCMCGHYTQVVWSKSQRVGCGNVTCNNELGLLFVCSYDPPGNYPNVNPFEKANNPATRSLTTPPPPPCPTTTTVPIPTPPQTLRNPNEQKTPSSPSATAPPRPTTKSPATAKTPSSPSATTPPRPTTKSPATAKTPSSPSATTPPRPTTKSPATAPPRPTTKSPVRARARARAQTAKGNNYRLRPFLTENSIRKHRGRGLTMVTPP